MENRVNQYRGPEPQTLEHNASSKGQQALVSRLAQSNGTCDSATEDDWEDGQ